MFHSPPPPLIPCSPWQLSMDNPVNCQPTVTRCFKAKVLGFQLRQLATNRACRPVWCDHLSTKHLRSSRSSRHRHFSRWAYHQSAHSHHHHLWLAPAWVITWPHYTLWSEELKDTISESYTLKLNIAWQRLFLLSWDQIGAATFRTNIRL